MHFNTSINHRNNAEELALKLEQYELIKRHCFCQLELDKDLLLKISRFHIPIDCYSVDAVLCFS